MSLSCKVVERRRETKFLKTETAEEAGERETPLGVGLFMIWVQLGLGPG